MLYKGINRFIINITSEGAILKREGYYYIVYGSSKSALNMYTQKIRNYLISQESTSDIRVFMIHPGRMFTKMGIENAQIEPSIPSSGIWDIIENKITINFNIPFINYKGERMYFEKYE